MVEEGVKASFSKRVDDEKLMPLMMMTRRAGDGDQVK